MREKLIQYVDLLFAGADCDQDVKQEILQNTLDRYDDLLDQGKAPEAAYRLAISGIGDVNEILGGQPLSPVVVSAQSEKQKMNRKLVTGIAIGLYILCPVPLFILQNELGLCLLLVVVAIATGLLIWAGGDKAEEVHRERQKEHQNMSPLEKSISQLISTVTLIVYLILSFATGAWYITWVLFPLSGAVRGLIHAIMDLKEAQKYEN